MTRNMASGHQCLFRPLNPASVTGSVSAQAPFVSAKTLNADGPLP